MSSESSPDSFPEIGVGLLGTGFMGRLHAAGYLNAAAAGVANRIVAVSGRGATVGDAAARGNLPMGTELVDSAFAEALRTTDPAEVYRHRDVDVVSICTPTDTHVDLAEAALAAGKHVLIEKPVALSSDEVRRLLDASRKSAKVCMPAMCVRFWPGWDWLKARIADRSFGAVKSATFRRIGSPPDWSRAFYSDARRTGGALFDLHIHDADFLRHCFGEPSGVSAFGSLDHLVATYDYPDGPELVVAEGGWNQAPGFGFRMDFTVAFEGATADFSLGREPELNLCRDGLCEPVEFAAENAYDREVRCFLKAVRAGSTEGTPSLEDALAVTRILEAEAESLRSGSRVLLPPL